MSYLYLTILSAAFIILECLIGGTRLLFSLPSYLLLGLASVLTVISARRIKIPTRPSCLISAAVLAAYILARAWWSPVEYLARPDFFMVLAALAVYLLTSLYLVRSSYRMIFIAVLLAIALGETMLALVQFSNGQDQLLFGLQRYPNGHRGSGQYVSPNHLAGYLEVVAIIGMSLVFWGTWKPWAKILTGYVSLVAFAGIMMTGSRGGYISTACCLVAFCALSVAVIKMAFPERLLRVLLVGGIVIALICAAAPFVVTSTLVRARAGNIVANDIRLKLWPAAWKEAQLDPVFGMGSGSYLIYGRKFRDPDVQTDPIRVHNDYLDMLAEYGIAGEVAILAFVVLHLKNGVHSFIWLVRKRLQFSADWRSSSLALNIGCLCAVAAYIVHSGVDFNLHIPANALLMAFVFGILANPGLETFHGGTMTIRANQAFHWLLPLLGLAILGLGAPKLPGEYYAEKARTSLRDKDYGGAMLAAKAGIAWEKKNPDLYYYLGEAKRNIGGAFPTPVLSASFYRSASDAYMQGLELFPQDVRLLLIEGWILDALGQHQEAEGYFQKSLEWDANWEPTQKSYENHLKIENISAKPAGDS